MNQPQLGSFESIPLTDIGPSSTNPRKHFDQAALEELAASIREAGVQQPIILRPSGAIVGKGKAPAPYEIVAGERRWRASEIAGLAAIPAIVRDLSDAEAYRTQILENLQREDLGPMEEAEGFAVLSKQGLGSAEIAAKVGKAPAYIHQRVKLLDLVKGAQLALRQQAIPVGFALEIAKLQPKEQTAVTEWCIGSDQWRRPKSVEDLRRRINEEFRLELKSAPFSIKATNLHATAGSCVDCKKRTGADTLLFGDVQGDDRCLDSKCFKTKVATLVHIRIEELKKEQGTAQLVSESYYPQSEAPKGTLGSEKYARADKGWPSCENSELAIIVEGARIGQKMRICTQKDCKVHRPGGRDRLNVAADKKRLEADRKAKLEQKIRIRIAEKLAERVLADASRAIDDTDVLELANYAFHRMDGTQTTRLAKMFGWDEKMLRYNGDKARQAKLQELGAGKAAVLAVLASVAGEFSVQHSWSSAPANKLAAFAKRNGVDVDAIRKGILAEAAAKAEKKTPAVKAVAKKAVATKKGVHAKPARLTPEARKRIATAMKKRWAARTKKAAAK